MSDTEAKDNALTDDEFDDIDDDFCIDCGDVFHYDDIGGYNPPCSCGMHCRRCHELAQRGDDDFFDDDERDDEEFERATERFWDGRVGHSTAATDDDLPF